MRAKEIEQRREAIGLTKKRLAELAGLDETTVGLVLNGKTNPLTSTVEKIEAALLAEELSRRDHLVELHGTQKGEAA